MRAARKMSVGTKLRDIATEAGHSVQNVTFTVWDLRFGTHTLAMPVFETDFITRRSE